MKSLRTINGVWQIYKCDIDVCWKATHEARGYTLCASLPDSFVDMVRDAETQDFGPSHCYQCDSVVWPGQEELNANNAWICPFCFAELEVDE